MTLIAELHEALAAALLARGAEVQTSPPPPSRAEKQVRRLLRG
jgi:hypothetical protein